MRAVIKGFSPRLHWLLAVVVLVVLDQASKAYIANNFALGSSLEITPWLNLVHLLNTGAAFSFLADAGGWQRVFLVAVALAIIVPVSLVCLKQRASRFERGVGAAVVAGGTGNLIDRLQTGAVVDFLDVHWKALHWPAFNLADVYVVCALAAWAWATFRQRDTSDVKPVPHGPNP